MLKSTLLCYAANVIARRMYSEVRVRFAPSPTGFLHLGGLRTALYNHLFARANGGTFVLRIEDTDQSRLVPDAAQQLQRDLEWAGIEIQEGPTRTSNSGNFGPYVQSQRLAIYQEYIKTLLDNGSAYPCFCTDRRLDLLRKEAVRTRAVPKYDNRCRHLSKEETDKRMLRKEKYCIRFKLKSGCDTFDDMIYGTIAYDVALNEGDPVVMKSDGFPTYHFANVVDDHLMQISHVLRGVEWQISTTKHILMYKAFNWTPPRYGHLPLLLNSDGSKLSKRQGDIRVDHYRANGILPLALVNYVTSAGGGFVERDRKEPRGSKVSLLDMEELADQFDLGAISAHSGRLMTDRLVEYNRLELTRRCDDPHASKALRKQVRQLVCDKFSEKVRKEDLNVDDDYINFVLKWSLNRIYTLSDLVSSDLAFIWVRPNVDMTKMKLKSGSIEKLCSSLKNYESFDKDNIAKLLKKHAQMNEVDYGDLMKSLRTILSGLKEGPSVAEMMEILGKDGTISRLKSCLQ